MTRSLHTGRGIKKARLEKRARRMKSELNNFNSEIVGKRKVGLKFVIKPDCVDFLTPLVEEIIAIYKFKEYLGYRFYFNGHTLRRDDEEIRSGFYTSHKRYELILSKEKYEDLSTQAKSLLKESREISRNVYTGKMAIKLSYKLPNKYWKFDEQTFYAPVYSHPWHQNPDAIQLHREVWEKGESRRIDHHHRRDDWGLNPYIRSNRKTVLSEYQSYLKELDEDYAQTEQESNPTEVTPEVHYFGEITYKGRFYEDVEDFYDEILQDFYEDIIEEQGEW